MSRGIFILGLLLSAALHAWLLMLPARPPATPARPVVIPVVETELARLQEDNPTPEPAAEVMPAPTPEPEPPAPEPEPAPDLPKNEPPQPPLVKSAETPATEVADAGDFAGDPEGRQEPLLRIDWGSGREALTTIETGGMVMVVLSDDEDSPMITQQVVYDDGTWTRQPYQQTARTRFSNRLRIVDHVPAFRQVQDDVDLSGRERLAVLVPMDIERVLEAAQMEAAFHRGLVMNQIDNFAGRFALRDGRLAFDITHVRENARSASP